MKKIYYFIQKHKYLKIILAIFFILNVLWYFILNIVLIVGLSMPNDEDYNLKLNNLATTPIKNAADYNGGVYYYGSAELFSVRFLNDFIDYATEYRLGGSNNWQYNTPGNATYEASGTTALPLGEYYTLNADASAITTKDYITGFGVYKYADNSHRASYVVRYFFNGASDVYISCVFHTFYHLDRGIFDDFDGELSGEVVTIQQYDLLNLSSVYLNYGVFGVSRFDDFGEIFVEIQTEGNMTYGQGYNSGYSTGYNSGYQTGYQEGQAAPSDQRQNSVFDLLTGAFNAIAGILNINILPGLTLGVLLFTPVIVTIIIVVVKMIKG